MVYQSRSFADRPGSGWLFTLGEADLRARAMGKRKRAEMQKQPPSVRGGLATSEGVMGTGGLKPCLKADVLFAEINCFRQRQFTAYGA